MPTTAHLLINSFLAGDAPSASALLAPAATFHSPIRDYTGAPQIDAVWHAVSGVVAGAQPTSVHERDGETIAFFAGAIRHTPVDGVLRAITDGNDRVTDVTLMLRPWAALKAGLNEIAV
ncbi:MAG: hypothetical protein M3071_19830 [Actinomycetota bacterium]|nr:hypothetical protein [Actinomycetota bacterium]